MIVLPGTGVGLHAATFVVTNSNDNGAGSLRQAILDANGSPGADTIAFNIPGAVTSIALSAALPVITNSVTLDGATQPGYTGAPLIELNGVSAGTGGDGLRIAASNCTIRALVINRFANNGIALVTGGMNIVEGCYIGLNAAGTTNQANRLSGILITNSANNVIGGTSAFARNMISGNSQEGIRLEGIGATNNQVLGNVIGLGVNDSDLGNGQEGIRLGAPRNIIGGTALAARNVISGNNHGIQMIGTNSTGNRVVGNFIGTDSTGTLDRGNNVYGVLLNGAPANTIGGTVAGSANVISGGNEGISLGGVGAAFNQVLGNFIGTDVTGTAPLGNLKGVVVSSNARSNNIGAIGPGAANTIAFNTIEGVSIGSGTNNAIRANAIFSNGALGIDLFSSGVTSNDFFDVDAGANNLQNYPILVAATNSPSGTFIQGRLSSRTNTAYQIDFYANYVCDPAGFGEGHKYLGSLDATTDSNGTTPFDVTFPIVDLPGRALTATATDPSGNTSEFSPCLFAVSTRSGLTFTVTNLADDIPGSLRQAILDANASINSGDTIAFRIPIGLETPAEPFIISPASPLPIITDPVIVDAYTQPGAAPNTLADGFNANLRIRLDGAVAGAANGLELAAGASVVRGLIITRFGGVGIRVSGTKLGFGTNVIEGNIIGLDDTGADRGNNLSGVHLLGSPGNLVGGTTPAARNVLSGNGLQGVHIEQAPSSANRVQGNFVGTDLTGTAGRGNGAAGISVNNCADTMIGGLVAGARNVVGGSGSGIELRAATNTLFQGNHVGVAANGTMRIPNSQNGLFLESSVNSLVGGTAPGAGNIILGNGYGSGVLITGSAAATNVVMGNLISSNAHGVYLTGGHDSVIGGSGPGEGNSVWSNSVGVVVISGTNNSIRGNSIFANASAGIDLGNNGVTANDTGDSDIGANNLQNFPVLLAATNFGSATVIRGTLNSRPFIHHTLDFYSNQACDPAGYGEGQTYLGTASVTTAGTGNGSFLVTLPVSASGSSVTATATDPDGNTSEFSACVTVIASGPPGGLPDLRLSRSGHVGAMAVQDDGHVIIGGSFTSVNGIPRRNLARLSPNGSVDGTWAPDADGVVRALLITGSDVFVGGAFTQVAGQTRYGLAKLGGTGFGVADATWNPAQAPTVVWALALSGTNLFVGGSFGTIGGRNRSNLAKLSTLGLGTADPLWLPDPNGSVLALTLHGTNLYAGGGFQTIGGHPIPQLARLPLEGTGQVDSAWQPNPNGAVINALTAAGGSLYVAGDFHSIGGLPRNRIAKLDALEIGVTDPAWDPSPQGPGDAPELARIDSLLATGAGLFVGGSFAAIKGQLRRNLALVSLSGSGENDPRWNGAAEAEVFALAASPVYLFVGGGSTGAAASCPRSLTKIALGTGTPDPEFVAKPELPGRINAMVQQPDGKIVLGGVFCSADELACRSLVRLNGDGSVDVTWRPELNGEVFALAANETSLFVGGLFDQIGGVSVSNVAKLPITGTDAVDGSWSPNPNGPVLALALAGSNLYVGGTFTNLAGQRTNLARVSTLLTGAVDVGWRPDPNGTVRAIAVVDTDVFVGGSFLTIGGQALSNLVKVTTLGSGTAVAEWTLPLNGLVRTLAVSGTNLFAGGEFTRIGNATPKYLAKLNTGRYAAADGNWKPTPTLPVAAVSVSGTNVYWGETPEGSSNGSPSLIRIGKATTSGSGTPDENWDYLADGAVSAVMAAGSQVYVGGAFSRINLYPRSGVALLASASPPSIVQEGQTNILIFRNQADGPEVSYFRIVSITGGALFLADGTPVKEGDFISVAQGERGLLFTPDPGATNVAISAVGALNNTPAGAGTISTSLDLTQMQRPALAFSSARYSVAEARSLQVSVRKLGSGPAQVNFATLNGTALATSDYRATNGALVFGATETNQIIYLETYPDESFSGDLTFTIRLSDPAGGSVLANPATAIITILEDDILGSAGSFLDLRLPDPPAPPDTNGVLKVTLEPPEAFGQWRLAGDALWRSNGEVVAGLARDNYWVEFRPVLGYRTPEVVILPIFSGETNVLSETYVADPRIGRGNLNVVLRPDRLANEADANKRAQWRRPGETGWRNSGETMVDVQEGTHTLEFKSVPGYVAPLNPRVQVFANQTVEATRIYLFATSNAAPAPVLLTFDQITATNLPYLFNGEIQSDLGFGSGVVVKERVVLTAAHVLFNDVTLSYAVNVRWFHQKHRGNYAPVQQSPRGWYIFDGYASQRQLDSTPGLSTLESQNLDAAAMYFVEDPLLGSINTPARAGYGGYLASDASDGNEYLLSNRPKMLVGYPLEGVPPSDWGKMHATVATNLMFHRVQAGVYATDDVRSLPGNSGGPFYVQHENGKYYPAGIYLGGVSETRVRAIDSQVVDLINRAEISGRAGGNNTGGGVITIAPGLTVGAFATGYVKVMLGPPEAVQAGAAWLVRDKNIVWTSDPNTRIPLAGGGSFIIEFREVPRFALPTNQVVHVGDGESTIALVALYRDPTPSLSYERDQGLRLHGLSGEAYNVEFADRLTVPLTNWGVWTNVTLSNGWQQIGGTDPTNRGSRFYRSRWVP